MAGRQSDWRGRGRGPDGATGEEGVEGPTEREVGDGEAVGRMATRYDEAVGAVTGGGERGARRRRPPCVNWRGSRTRAKGWLRRRFMAGGRR
jgi:hypothetical protein